MATTKNKILVTGATGFIGSNLAESLIKSGREVRCLVRGSSKDTAIDYLKSMGAELVYGDLLDNGSLAKSIEGVDVVFHLSAVFDYMAPKKITFRVNVEGTRNLLDACVKSGVKKFVHCSTIGVMGPTGKTPANEKAPYNPDASAYAQSKCEAEKLVLEYNKKYKLPVVVVRPAAVYGPRGFYNWYGTLKLASEGRASFILGPGDNFQTAVYVTDVVQGFMLAEKKGKAGEIYLIAGKPATLKEVSEIIAKVLNMKPPTRHAPAWMAKLMAFMYETKARLFGGTPPFTSATIDFAVSDRIYDISKAKKELGYEPHVGLEEGMRKTVQWFKDNGYL